MATKSFPYLMVSIILFLALVLAGSFYYLLTQKQFSKLKTDLAYVSPVPVSASVNLLGTVSGKLCFPSEVLPKGLIEAKRISDNKIFSQDYPGSENGGAVYYNFKLEQGNYQLRYKTDTGLIGYSTTACPTGSEPTCGNTEQRVLNVVEVKPNESFLNYHLCDFYYQSALAPQF